MGMSPHAAAAFIMFLIGGPCLLQLAIAWADYRRERR
jgi:hypothetical protein